MDAARDGSTNSPMITAADVDRTVGGAGLEDELLGTFAGYFPDHEEKILRTFQRLVAMRYPPGPAAVKAAVEQLLQGNTAADLLASCLPPLDWSGHTRTSSTTGGGMKYFVPPDGVAPLSERIEKWADEIIKVQHDADGIERWAFPLDQGENPPADSEAGLAHELHNHLKQLWRIQNKLQGQPSVVGWASETSATLLRDGAVDYVQSHPSAAPRLASHSAMPAPSSSSSSSSRTDNSVSKIGTGAVFLVKEQPAAHHQQPPLQQQSPGQPTSVFQQGRPVAVGEYKKPGVLASQAADSSWQPMDLLDDFYEKIPRALHVIGQIYTHLLLLQLQYGFISCYYWTWVVYLGADRRKLYLSEPIAHCTSSSADSPAVTVMSAIYWTQLNGYRTYTEQVQELPHDLQTVEAYLAATAPLPPSSEPDIYPSQGPDDSDFDLKKPDASPHRSGKGTGSSSRGTSRQPSSKPGVNKKINKNKSTQQHRTPGATAGLLLGAVIYHGCSGPVLEGTCNGQRAVIKMFGPDEEGLAAYRSEVDAYRTLAPVQGSAMPKLLACGHFAVGVHYIATARVDGVPYSRLPCVHEAAAVAAERAMLQIRSVRPCFVHGDLRLANIMLQLPGADTATPTAMIIDFAASRLDASPLEVAVEVRQLRALLRKS